MDLQKRETTHVCLLVGYFNSTKYSKVLLCTTKYYSSSQSHKAMNLLEQSREPAQGCSIFPNTYTLQRKLFSKIKTLIKLITPKYDNINEFFQMQNFFFNIIYIYINFLKYHKKNKYINQFFSKYIFFYFF